MACWERGRFRASRSRVVLPVQRAALSEDVKHSRKRSEGKWCEVRDGEVVEVISVMNDAKLRFASDAEFHRQ